MKNAVPKYKNLGKESLRSMKDTVKKKEANYIIWKERQGNEEEAIFEKLMGENLPELLKYTQAQIQKF